MGLERPWIKEAMSRRRVNELLVEIVLSRKYIDEVLKDLGEDQMEDKNLLRQDHNEEHKAKRKSMVDDFMKPGNPGLKLKSEFDRMIRNLVS